MKRLSVAVMTAAMLMSGFFLTGCAEKDHMSEMDKSAMNGEMKKDTKMMKTDESMNMSDKEMEGEMKEPMQKEMDSMKDGMDKTMTEDMKKME